METIKFRAWDRKNRKWLSECNTLIDLNGSLAWTFGYEPLDYFSKEEMQEIDLIQFTGLLDKNGKEIYEGDIVKIKNYVNNAIIEWKDLSWNITPSGWSSYTLHQFHSSRLEIVGNIYENPELLNRVALS